MNEHVAKPVDVEVLVKVIHNWWKIQQILCQRENPNFSLFKEFGVLEEDVQYIRVLLHQTSVQNKEISVQIKATVENNSQMYRLEIAYIMVDL